MSDIFETSNNHKTNLKSSSKTILVITIPIIIAIAAGVYFIMPKHGDQVSAPVGLEDAIRQHFKTGNERSIVKITYYYCTSVNMDGGVRPLKHYVALVDLTPVPITERKSDDFMDLFQYRKIRAIEKENDWKLIQSPDLRALRSNNTKTEPCENL